MLSSRSFPLNVGLCRSRRKCAARPSATSPQSRFRSSPCCRWQSRLRSPPVSLPAMTASKSCAECPAAALRSRRASRCPGSHGQVASVPCAVRNGEQCGPLISVVDNLQRPRRLLAQGHDLIVGQRSVAAVDVSDHIGIGCEDDVFVDQAGTGDRGPPV